METELLVNGQILAAARKKLQDAQKRKHLATDKRDLYEVLELLVMYIAEDHPKTRQMFAVYRPMVWVSLVFGASLLTALATGHVVITLSP